jgi:hypothetical protein
MLKSYFTYTAIIEGLTGLACIIIPGTVALLLFQADLNAPIGTLFAMIAGSAILALAIASWLVRKNKDNAVMSKVLIFYNLLIALVLLYGVLALGFKGVVLWGVIIFHLFQTVTGIRIIQKDKI